MLVYFKVEDLSRIYRLYHKIPKGLDPVAAVFKQVSWLFTHVLRLICISCFFIILVLIFLRVAACHC